MARCMFYSKGLYKGFGDESICHANYILKRVPNKVVLQVTPEEKYNGGKHNIIKFKNFGSECYLE